MGSVRIHRVTVEAFRSFKERHTTSFLPRNGLVGIRGRNLDTGGSSGSGKSSIAAAIAYALGYSIFSAKSLQCKFTKKPMQVEVELETDEGPVIVRRGKVTSIQVGEVETTGSIPAVDAEITRIIGLPADLLKALTYRPQGTPGLFLSMKDAQKKEFLAQLLGLEELETRIEEAVKSSNKMKEEIARLESNVTLLKGQIVEPTPIAPRSGEAELSRALASTYEKEALRDAAVIEKLKAEHKRVVDKFYLDEAAIVTRLLDDKAAIKEKNEAERQATPPPPKTIVSEQAQFLRGMLAECEKRLTNAKAEQQAKLKDVDDKIVSITNIINALNRAIDDEPVLVTHMEILQENIQKTEENLCPTCKQEWVKAIEYVATLQKQLQQILEKLAVIKIKCSERMVQSVAQNALRQVRTEILADTTVSKLQEALTIVRESIAKETAANNYQSQIYQSAYDVAEAARDQRLTTVSQEATPLLLALRNKKDEELKLINADLATLNECLNNSKARAVQCAHEADRLDASYNHAVAMYTQQATQAKKLRDQLEILQKQADGVIAKQAAEQDFAAALKAFLGSIFDEVLVEISHEANELIKALPNVTTATIAFTSEQVTGKGVARKEIRPVLMKSGQVFDIEENLSGGQATSVDLAVDIGLMTVIRRRTGRCPNWLVLDESFEGHDVPVKESCLEVLQRAAQNSLILVVDHASELKEYFTAFVDVESQNDISRIVEG